MARCRHDDDGDDVDDDDDDDDHDDDDDDDDDDNDNDDDGDDGGGGGDDDDDGRHETTTTRRGVSADCSKVYRVGHSTSSSLPIHTMAAPWCDYLSTKSKRQMEASLHTAISDRRAVSKATLRTGDAQARRFSSCTALPESTL